MIPADVLKFPGRVGRDGRAIVQSVSLHFACCYVFAGVPSMVKGSPGIGCPSTRQWGPVYHQNHRTALSSYPTPGHPFFFRRTSTWKQRRKNKKKMERKRNETVGGEAKRERFNII